MDAIVLAGGLPGPDDPIYQYSQDKPKALVKLGEKTMIEWIVGALQGAEGIDDVLLVGITEAMAREAGIVFDRPVSYLPDSGNVVTNNYNAVRHLQSRKPEQDTYLLCLGDVPLITADMVDYFIDICQPHNCVLYYSVVTDDVMEARFPGSNRSFVRFTEANVAGGDIYIFKAALLQQNEAFFQAFVDARKNAFQLARTIGLKFLVKLIFRRLSLAELEETGLRIFREPIKVVPVKYAELGMDADKPNQIELVQAELSART